MSYITSIGGLDYETEYRHIRPKSTLDRKTGIRNILSISMSTDMRLFVDARAQAVGVKPSTYVRSLIEQDKKKAL